LEEWRAMLADLASGVGKMTSGPVAIYGAGFYGALFHGILSSTAVCFLDRNPHLQGGTLCGLPILPPEACPDVSLVVAALNPAKARKIITPGVPWLPACAQIFYPAD